MEKWKVDRWKDSGVEEQTSGGMVGGGVEGSGRDVERWRALTIC